MLLEKRLVYSPFEYPLAHEYWLKQQMSHWLHTEIQMNSDVMDWALALSPSERAVIGNILRGFVQSEVLIEDYWSTKVTHWFKKPEIQMMAASFANMESVHAVSYAYLQETLGLNDFDGFLHEPSAKAKIDRLLSVREKNSAEIARSLAVFSAFTEGVNLFSSFAVLMSFSRRNLLKGVGQIIAFSIRDESLHSEAGCWLFRTFVQEYPEVLTEDLKEQIYAAARLTVELEDNFIDQSFSLGEIESISSEDLKAYIRFRTNTKLKDIGLKSVWRPNKDKLNNLEWFSVMSSGVELQDFFAGRVSSYSKGVAEFQELKW